MHRPGACWIKFLICLRFKHLGLFHCETVLLPDHTSAENKVTVRTERIFQVRHMIPDKAQFPVMSLIVAWTIESPLIWTPVAPLFKSPLQRRSHPREFRRSPSAPCTCHIPSDSNGAGHRWCGSRLSQKFCCFSPIPFKVSMDWSFCHRFHAPFSFLLASYLHARIRRGLFLSTGRQRKKAASSGLLTKRSSFSVVVHMSGNTGSYRNTLSGSCNFRDTFCLLYREQVIIDRLTAVV